MNLSLILRGQNYVYSIFTCGRWVKDNVSIKNDDIKLKVITIITGLKTG